MFFAVLAQLCSFVSAVTGTTPLSPFPCSKGGSQLHQDQCPDHAELCEVGQQSDQWDDELSLLQFNGKSAQTGSRSQLRIPAQLILTSSSTLEELPGPVRRNIHTTLSLNPDLKLRWFSDAACQEYLSRHFDKELASIFEKELRGSFRGDTCRAAVLSREGGFYTDLDTEWVTPLQDLVDGSTSFMSVYGDGDETLNAVMAAEPRSEILEAILREIRNWYSDASNLQFDAGGAPRKGWMGPKTLSQALHDIQSKACPEAVATQHASRKTCGRHIWRFYEQRRLNCHLASENEWRECPPDRRKASFDGLDWGFFEIGNAGKLIGWPRFAECEKWGCEGGGWTLHGTRSPP